MIVYDFYKFGTILWFEFDFKMIQINFDRGCADYRVTSYRREDDAARTGQRVNGALQAVDLDLTTEGR